MCELVRIKTNQNKYVKVASLKRTCIEGVIKAAQKCAYIDQIILFGSALETRCNAGSDIDLAIISNVTRSRLFRSKAYDEFVSEVYHCAEGQGYDFLQFNSVESLEKDPSYVCREILKKGRTIYIRKEVA